jgi:hypothetical protein
MPIGTCTDMALPSSCVPVCLNIKTPLVKGVLPNILWIHPSIINQE